MERHAATAHWHWQAELAWLERRRPLDGQGRGRGISWRPRCLRTAIVPPHSGGRQEERPWSADRGGCGASTVPTHGRIVSGSRAGLGPERRLSLLLVKRTRALAVSRASECVCVESADGVLKRWSGSGCGEDQFGTLRKGRSHGSGSVRSSERGRTRTLRPAVGGAE